MIDTFSILFSTVMVVLILVRAVKLDRTLPWFPAPSRPGPASPPSPPPRGSARPGRPPPEAPAAAPRPPARGAGRPGGGAGPTPVRARTLPGVPPPRRAGR